MNIRKGVFDRIGDSVILFKNNFIGLFVPFFLYNFISIVIIGTISKFYMMTSFDGIEKFNGMDFFNIISDPTVILIIVIGIFLFLLYLLIYIIIFLGFLKSAKQAINKEKITILQNINYGFHRFFKSMKTYWYIFSYVALIPALLFIIGGIFFNAGYYFLNIDILKYIGVFFMIISIVLFIFFSIYRGIKVTFALYSAVNEDSFNKENFNYSLKITNNNWWRITGNFLLIGILVFLISMVGGFILGKIGLLVGEKSSMWLFFSSMNNGNINPELLKSQMNVYFDNYSIYLEIFLNTIDNLIKTILTIFVLIFTYIFFLRLKLESKAKTELKTIDNEKGIEL